MNRIQIVNDALQELADRLIIPCDIISAHRQDGLRVGGRTRMWQSLRYGSFLLTHGPFEGFFDNLTDYRARKHRSIGTDKSRIGQQLKERFQKDATASWAARTRVAPMPGTGNRARWELLRGDRLRDYLSDMKSLRDLLSHGGDPQQVSNKSGTLWPVRGGLYSMRLMGVEGFIQAVQDIASCTAVDLIGQEAELPDWPQPILSGVSATGQLPAPY